MARIETAARWSKATERAAERGVQVRQLATSGVWIATSSTDATADYVVTVAGCECRAGAEDDPVCCSETDLERPAIGSRPLGWEPPISSERGPVAG